MLPRMRFTIEFGGVPQDVTVTTEGTATPDGFAQMNAELVEDERFRPGMLVLLDHTSLGVNELSSEDVRSIAKDFLRHDAAFGSTVVALVAPEPVQFGLARMATALADPMTPIIRIFETRQAAMEWLGKMREAESGTTT